MLVLNTVGKGTYWRAFHFARHLVGRGHAVTLLATQPVPGSGVWARTTMRAGVEVVEVPDLLWGPLRSGWDPWAVVARIRFLHGRQFDLVHSFESRPTVLFPMLYLRRRGIPIVMDWGDWFGRGGSVEERSNRLIRAILRPVETFFEERFRSCAHATVVICTTLRQRAITLGVPPATITVLHDGADADNIRPLNRAECRSILGLPHHAPIIGYVGVIFSRDASLMAKAFDAVQAKNPEALLLLIGYFNRPIETLVAKPDAIIRTGEIRYEALSTYLSACNIGWLPYCDSGANRGRWPLKFNDYMAAGIPTVATAVGDVVPVIQQHEIGVLAQPEVSELAQKTLSLIDDPKECTRLGQNARLQAEKRDWRHQVEALEQCYAHAFQRAIGRAPRVAE